MNRQTCERVVSYAALTASLHMAVMGLEKDAIFLAVASAVSISLEGSTTLETCAPASNSSA
jgi:hypothetical protein